MRRQSLCRAFHTGNRGADRLYFVGSCVIHSHALKREPIDFRISRGLLTRHGYVFLEGLLMEVKLGE